MISSVTSVLIVLAMVYFMAKGGFILRTVGFRMFILFIQLAFATTSALFYYLICDRALKAAK